MSRGSGDYGSFGGGEPRQVNIIDFILLKLIDPRPRRKQPNVFPLLFVILILLISFSLYANYGIMGVIPVLVIFSSIGLWFAYKFFKRKPKRPSWKRKRRRWR